MIGFRGIGKVFDIVGGIAAFFTVILIGLLYVNVKYNFLPADTAATLATVREYAVLLTLAVVGMGFACRRGLILFVLYVVFAAVALGFSFPALF